ncbi:MAG TPA: hypothetical protein VIF61_12860 [Methylocystis sp.]
MLEQARTAGRRQKKVRHRARWSPSSIKNLLDRARKLGLFGAE